MKYPEELTNTYEIYEQIGAGGGGTVFRANHKRLQKLVVLKKLKGSKTSIQECRTEVDILKNLRHSYLPQVLDFIESDAGIYTVMDFIPGKSLRQMLDEGYKFTEKEVLKYTRQLCEALDYLHSQKPSIIHGDIKPDNLLIRDGDGVLKLADLGLAKIVGKDDLATDIMATPLYASPEVILADAANIGVKSDIYSFGIMLYELLTGKAPFRGNVESVLRQHVDKEPVPLEKARSDLDRELAAFINRMISKSPADRPYDWEEIKNVLQKIRARTPDGGKSKSPRRVPGKQICSLILSVISLILAAGIIFAIFKLF